MFLNTAQAENINAAKVESSKGHKATSGIAAELMRSKGHEQRRQISTEALKRKEMNKYATLLRQRLNDAVADIKNTSGSNDVILKRLMYSLTIL